MPRFAPIMRAGIDFVLTGDGCEAAPLMASPVR